MSSTSRRNVKISIQQGSFQIGIECEYDDLDAIVGKIAELEDILFTRQSIKPEAIQNVQKKRNSEQDNTSGLVNQVDDENISFGEYLHGFKDDLNSSDYILISGYYCQKRSEDSTFVANEASAELKQQGIKLSNPTVFIKNNIEQNRMFIDGKAGVKINRYKVSRDGIKYIQTLLREA